jgi:hypothetical protein
MKAWVMIGFVLGGEGGSETHPEEKARRSRKEITLVAPRMMFFLSKNLL